MLEVFNNVVQTAIHPPFVGIFYLPAFCYRFMLKAMAIVYFPLFLTIRRVTADANVWDQLEDVRDHEWSTFTRRLAWIIGSLVLVKIGLYSLEIRLVEDWATTPLRKLVSLIIVPLYIPLWQYASLINAGLVISFYYITACILRWRRHGQVFDEQSLLTATRIFFFTTGMLSFYATLCNVWIVAHHRHFLQFPPVGKWWP